MADTRWLESTVSSFMKRQWQMNGVNLVIDEPSPGMSDSPLVHNSQQLPCHFPAFAWTGSIASSPHLNMWHTQN